MKIDAKNELIGNADQWDIERQALALDALSKLTTRFSKGIDFAELIQVMLWTLSGQFSIANSFAIVKRPGSPTGEFLYLGTGKLTNSAAMQQFEISSEHHDFFVNNPGVSQVMEMEMPGNLASFVFIASECGIKLVCPLVNSSRFMGLIGLGKKVNNKPFDKVEIDLISTLIQTVTPFLANSYLFWEMAAMKAWYVDILDSINQGVFVFDENNRLKKVNSAGYKILQALKPSIPDPGMLEGAPLDLIFPENIFSGWIFRFNPKSEERGSSLIENMIARSGAIKKIFNVRVSLSVNESNSGKDLIITLDDITQQKENEEQMFNLEKLADRGSMASSIAHELNNFLGMVMGGSELVDAALKRDNVPQAQEILAKVKEQIMNMERFTNGLMDYERLEPCKTQADINKVISDVISFVSIQKKFRNLKIKSNLSKEIPVFEMDAEQIAQVIMNFMSNAADAVAQASRKEGIISIQTALEDDIVALTVSDNGCGMPDDVKASLFKARLTTKESGHGYGLLTSAKIIKNHHGTIDIESTPGKGARFIIRFKTSK